MSRLFSKAIKCLLLLGWVFGFSLGIGQTVFAYDYDCDDFTYQEEAQDEYDSNYGDVYRLDGDDDGVACETLPSEEDDYYDSDVYGAYTDDYESSDYSTYDPSLSEFASTDDYAPEDSGTNWSWLWWMLGIGFLIAVFSN